MASSETDIGNLALGRAGSDKTILSFNEGSKEARLCLRFYEFCRDEVLERAPWPFAVRVQALAALPVATLLPGWQYQYALPTDCLNVLAVVPASDVTDVSNYYCACNNTPWAPVRPCVYAFRKAMNDAGTLPTVLTNVSDAYIVYVSRVINTAAYTAMFVGLLADRLAMEISIPLTLDPRWFQVCQTRYAAAFIDTGSRQFEQQANDPPPDAPSIRARY
jgi:hypothetical protein